MIKNNKITIFLDIDACIAALMDAVCKRFNLPIPSNQLLPDTYLYDKVAKNEFWAKIHVNEYDFWVKEIQPYYWAKDLIKTVSNHTDDWCFLSKPSRSGDCHKGKFDWLNKHFGLGHKLWLSGGNKEYAAGPNKILIDDKEENCQKWIERGGSAFRWEEFSSDIDKQRIFDRLNQLNQFLESFK
jgi:hypothetical protein